MSEHTFKRLVKRLTQQVMQHPHKKELTALMQEQLLDDTIVLVKDQNDTSGSGPVVLGSQI